MTSISICGLQRRKARLERTACRSIWAQRWRLLASNSKNPGGHSTSGSSTTWKSHRRTESSGPIAPPGQETSEVLRSTYFFMLLPAELLDESDGVADSRSTPIRHKVCDLSSIE